MGRISNLDLFTPYKKHGLTYRCIGVTTTVGTYLPQEWGAGAALTQHVLSPLQVNASSSPAVALGMTVMTKTMSFVELKQSATAE